MSCGGSSLILINYIVTCRFNYASIKGDDVKLHLKQLCLSPFVCV